jgi:hypothetical protein
VPPVRLLPQCGRGGLSPRTSHWLAGLSARSTLTWLVGRHGRACGRAAALPDELCVTELASVIWAVQMSTVEFYLLELGDGLGVGEITGAISVTQEKIGVS